ncbi:MAG: hypothetical protein HYU36_06035 [Planctomycetes bacterium]|nr:hypothetical protein [Planctomycetota bacterium]
MPNPKRVLRGLQDIRTSAGRVDAVAAPYRVFMRVTCLEMEKARRSKERESAMLRVKMIDERLREIEGEKGELLNGLLELGHGGSEARPGRRPGRESRSCRDRRNLSPGVPPPAAGSPLRLRY